MASIAACRPAQISPARRTSQTVRGGTTQNELLAAGIGMRITPPLISPPSGQVLRRTDLCHG